MAHPISSSRLKLKYKASDYIAAFIEAQKITSVFEVAGGMITHILDSLSQKTKIHIVSVHHEQAAAFSADAFGRVTGKPGIALATSGPGATNLLTGIASCYFDSCPALFITGQVNTHEQKGSKNIRQLGFQETDIISMATPITKWSVQVTQAHNLPGILEEAYRISISDRPGPVLIDIPMNIQRMEIDCPEPTLVTANTPHFSSDPTSYLQTLLNCLKTSKRPLILAGGGVNAARARKSFLEFIELFNIPVVTSLLGLDLLPYHHPLRVGFIGSYGNRWANLALGECDFLLVLGSRLDIRQTGADTQSFSLGKTILHVDCDPNEINNRVINCSLILSDLQLFFDSIFKALNTQKIIDTHSMLDLDLLPAQTGFTTLKNLESENLTQTLDAYQWPAWHGYILELKTKWPDVTELKNIQGINPNVFLHALSKSSGKAAGYSVDVGSHQMWAAQSIEILPNQLFITSAGMGAMGYALPAAIGFSLAYQKKPIVVIVGDGCLQMNIQELQTIVRNALPIKIVVINNQSLGMIRQFQDSYFDSRYQSTYWGYSAPDFEKIARAYGISAQTLSQESEVDHAISELWSHPNQPALLQVMIEPHLHVYPKIAFGKPITEMEPFVKPIEMEGT